jgi:hypothetical protein
MTTVVPMTPPTMALDVPELPVGTGDVAIGLVLVIVNVPVKVVGKTEVLPSLRVVVKLVVKTPDVVNVVGASEVELW